MDTALRRAAAREMQFALGARAELGTMGELIRGRGWKVAVLKGGVAASGPEPVYLTDLDLLVDPARTEELARALAGTGYARGPGAESLQHLPARSRPGSLAVEIHHSLVGLAETETLLGRAVPLIARSSPPTRDREPSGEDEAEACSDESHGGLCRLAPADHLRHLLVHAGRQHPERRGMLRDLMLAGAAIRECSEAELRNVKDWLEEQPDRDKLLMVFDMSHELATGGAPEDRFRSIARRRYLMVRLWGGADEPALTGFARRRALTFLCGDRGWREELRAELRKPPTDSALPRIRRIARISPALAAGARRILRLGRFATAVAMGTAVLWVERRLKARYGSLSEHSSVSNGKGGPKATSDVA